MTRFAKFCAAGGAGFVLQLSLLAILVTYSALPYQVATALAVEAAILANFLVHQRWTWSDRMETGVVARLLKFNALTGIVSVLGSVVVTTLFVELLSLHPLPANILSIVALSFVNFVGADRWVFRAGLVIVMAAAAAAADAGEAKLEPKTAAAFAKYAAAVEAYRLNDAESGAAFLEFERHGAGEQARILTLLRGGEVFIEQATAARDATSKEIPVAGGLINHWRGTVFMPGVTLNRVLEVLQDPNIDHKQEDVLSSRIVPRDARSQKLYLRVKRTKFVTAVYDTEYDVEYRRLAGDRATSTSISTRIVEVENAGTPQERTLPEGNDRGFMWRLNSYWRYKQVDGGVLVEVESLTLSRELPAIVRPLVRPIVNSTARESIERTLTSMRARFSR